MNMKINGLWDKAVTLVEQEPDGDWSLDTIKDKFAELIIRECINAIDDGDGSMSSMAESCWRSVCIKEIKKHFGVEE